MRRLSERARVVDAGRVDEDDLRLGQRPDADDAVPRRLRLRRDDRDLRADERVQQRRLADVRPADDRDVSRAVGHGAFGAHGSHVSDHARGRLSRGPLTRARRFDAAPRVPRRDAGRRPGTDAVQALRERVGSAGSAPMAARSAARSAAPRGSAAALRALTAARGARCPARSREAAATAARAEVEDVQAERDRIVHCPSATPSSSHAGSPSRQRWRRLGTSRRSPDEAIRHNNLGVALMDAGPKDPKYFPEAIKEFEAALQSSPNYLTARINLGMAYYYAGQVDKALSTMTQVLKESPDNLYANYILGLLREMNGAFAEARVHFEKVTRADPEDPNSWFHLGYCYSKNRQYAEAIEPFRHAARLLPYQRRMRYNLYMALSRGGKADEAQTELENFRKLESSSVRVVEAPKSSMEYLKQGKYAEAIAESLPLSAPHRNSSSSIHGRHFCTRYRTQYRSQTD